MHAEPAERKRTSASQRIRAAKENMCIYINIDSGDQYDSANKNNIGDISSTHTVHRAFGNMHAIACG